MSPGRGSTAGSVAAVWRLPARPSGAFHRCRPPRPGRLMVRPDRQPGRRRPDPRPAGTPARRHPARPRRRACPCWGMLGDVGHPQLVRPLRENQRSNGPAAWRGWRGATWVGPVALSAFSPLVRPGTRPRSMRSCRLTTVVGGRMVGGLLSQRFPAAVSCTTW
jgi:hypothetical protein